MLWPHGYHVARLLVGDGLQGGVDRGVPRDTDPVAQHALGRPVLHGERGVHLAQLRVHRRQHVADGRLLVGQGERRGRHRVQHGQLAHGRPPAQPPQGGQGLQADAVVGLGEGQPELAGDGRQILAEGHVAALGGDVRLLPPRQQVPHGRVGVDPHARRRRDLLHGVGQHRVEVEVLLRVERLGDQRRRGRAERDRGKGEQGERGHGRRSHRTPRLATARRAGLGTPGRRSKPGPAGRREPGPTATTPTR